MDPPRATPFALPNGFAWADIDIQDEESAQAVYTLLSQNFVMNETLGITMDYQIPFLRWALTPEGYEKQWYVGVKVVSSGKLVGFISAIPTQLCIHNEKVQGAWANFL